ncbi:hypothetical protein HBH47_178110 [Parastagonospora nodorum]|nr:hypothetical protein HBH47_178110 [Parastagonospora nodorum]
MPPRWSTFRSGFFPANKRERMILAVNIYFNIRTLVSQLFTLATSVSSTDFNVSQWLSCHSNLVERAFCDKKPRHTIVVLSKWSERARSLPPTPVNLIRRVGPKQPVLAQLSL